MRPAIIPQHGMFGTNAWIIQSSRDGVDGGNLTKLILAEIRLHPVKNAARTNCQRGRRLWRINSLASRFTANQLDGWIIDKVVEAANRVGAAANTGNYGIRQAALVFKNLLTAFLRDHGLKITHDRWERIWSHGRTQDIMRIVNSSGPFAHGFGNRVLQRAGTGLNGMNLSPQQFHTVNV